MVSAKSKKVVSKANVSDDEGEIPTTVPVQKVKTKKSKSSSSSTTTTNAGKSSKQKPDLGMLTPLYNQLQKELSVTIKEQISKLEDKTSQSKTSTEYVTKKDFSSLLKHINAMLSTSANSCTKNQLNFMKKYKSIFPSPSPVDEESVTVKDPPVKQSGKKKVVDDCQTLNEETADSTQKKRSKKVKRSVKSPPTESSDMEE